jgi:adenine-specific DNA-methyltransferase
VKLILEEISGSDCFVSEIAFTKAAGGLSTSKGVPAKLDYLLWFSRKPREYKFNSLLLEKGDPYEEGFNLQSSIDGKVSTVTKEDYRKLSIEEKHDLCMSVLLTKPGPGAKYSVSFQGKKYDSGERWGVYRKQVLNAH